MARIIRCDKCAIETTDKDDVMHLQFDAGLTGHGVGNYDLCKRCVHRLIDWLKPDPKELPYRT